VPDHLIIAIGNALRGDDGVAARVITELGNRLAANNVLIVEQLTIELAPIVADSRHVLFVDASVALPPGKSELNSLSDHVEAASPLGHDLQPAELLSLSHSLFGSDTYGALLSIGAKDLDSPDCISPLLSSQLSRYASEILDWCRAIQSAERSTAEP
jgi:hydrogenase maturation protease